MEVQNDWGVSSTTEYTYGTDGHLEELVSANMRHDLDYNADGLLPTFTDGATGEATTYSYDSAGRVIGRTDPADMTWTRTYEPETGMVDTQTITSPAGLIADFDVDYDAAGNVISRKEIVRKPGGGNTPGSGTWTYDYDAVNRMVAATDPSALTTTYAYDRTGNRTSVKVGAAPAVTTTYDDAGLSVA